MCYILKYDWSIQSHPVPLITEQTNQPMRYTYLTPCRLQSGFPHSARHLDWQMPSMQDSHSQQTSAGSHTLQRGRSIISSCGFNPWTRIRNIPNSSHVWMNHISLKKGKPRWYAELSVTQDTFQPITGPTSCTGVTRGWGWLPHVHTQSQVAGLTQLTWRLTRSVPLF